MAKRSLSPWSSQNADGKPYTWVNRPRPCETVLACWWGAAKVARDITEKKAAGNTKYRQAQKMEAVGQTRRRGRPRLQQPPDHHHRLQRTAAPEVCPADDLGREMVEEIYRAGERSASLTRQLLVFSRKAARCPGSAGPQHPGGPMRRSSSAGSSARMCVWRPPSGRNWATSRPDPGQLEQVLMNLAVNARGRHAARGAGSTIETDAVVTGRELRPRPRRCPCRVPTSCWPCRTPDAA